MSDTEYSEARNLDFKNQDIDDVVEILSDIRERATIPSRHLLPPQQAVQQVLLRDVPWLCERVLRLEREKAALLASLQNAYTAGQQRVSFESATGLKPPREGEST